MTRLALHLAWKDLRLLLGRGAGLAQGILLGLLILFIFSLTVISDQRVAPRAASGIFWLCSVFSQIIVFNNLYANEETAGARDGLLLAPASVQWIWLGKTLAGFILLFLCQLIFAPATLIFLIQDVSGPLWPAFIALILGDIGISALTSLLGGLAANNSRREALLSILVFPFLTPLLLCAIDLSTLTLGRIESDALECIKGALAFDGIFTGAAIFLFGYLYEGDR